MKLAVLVRVASCAMVLAVSSQSLVRAEEDRTAANALLCASPLTIKEPIKRCSPGTESGCRY